MGIKCAVIGLDGATFDIINPMISQGKLPVLASLISKGVHGNLRSTILPNSFPGWASCTTGTSEGMHGIFSPFLKRREDYGVRAISALDIQTRTVWDILKSYDKTSGIINIPTTYPAEEVLGYQVTGMLTPSIKSKFTFPASLREEILKIIPNYIIEPRRALSRKEKAEEFRHCMSGHLEVAKYLLEKYPTDFFMIVFSVLDRAQHDFWADMDSTHFRYDPIESPEFSGFIEEIYSRADEAIGELLKYFSKETTIIICSDHGFSAELRELRVNEWLAQHNFLYYRENVFQKKNSTIEKLEAKFSYHFNSISTKLRPHNVLEKKVVFGKDFLTQIDWTKTLAYFGQDKGVWINVKGRDRAGVVNPEDFEKVRTDVQKSLLEWIDPQTRECIFESVLPREELLQGRFATQLPDLLLIPKNSQDVCLESPSLGAPIIPATTTTGTHAPDGIFIANGPNILKGKRIEGANLRDVTPAALYAMEIPLTEDMDGVPLKEAFSKNFLDKHPVKYSGTSYRDGQSGGENKEVFNAEESAELEERLRALGYLG